MVLPACYSCQTIIKDSAYKKIVLVDHTNQTFAVHTHFFPPCFDIELISTQLPQYRIIGTGDVFDWDDVVKHVDSFKKFVVTGKY